MRCLRTLVLLTVILGLAPPAFADATLFIGTAATPSNRTTKGFALGAGLLIVGFEFEYADTSEEPSEQAPGLRTGMGNVLLQTPAPILGLQPYVTTGLGAYRETLGGESATSYLFNNGFGVKVSLVGPLRARVDYRALSLRGSPRHSTVQRVYVGVNLNF